MLFDMQEDVHCHMAHSQLMTVGGWFEVCVLACGWHLTTGSWLGLLAAQLLLGRIVCWRMAVGRRCRIVGLFSASQRLLCWQPQRTYLLT